DVHAEHNAFVANEDRWPSDELADLVLALATERTVERILGIIAGDLAHLRTSKRRQTSQSSPRTPNQAHLIPEHDLSRRIARFSWHNHIESRRKSRALPVRGVRQVFGNCPIRVDSRFLQG